MAYLKYQGSIIDQIRDELKLDSFYRQNDKDYFDDESYDDASIDYDYTFDYAD